MGRPGRRESQASPRFNSMHAATVLLLHANPFLARSLQDQIRATLAPAVFHTLTDVASAVSRLREPVDLLVTGLEAPDGDVLDALVHLARNGRMPNRTLVLAETQGVRALITLWRLTIAGVFHLCDDAQNLVVALRTVEAKRCYWSPGLVAQLLTPDAKLVQSCLTPAEQLALSFMGGSCSDKEAAERMGMGLCAVRSLRQRLYAQLAVHDKEGLLRAAARLSFTRPSANGPVPMGTAQLIVEYIEQSKRPASLPASALACCGFSTDAKSFGSNPPFRKSG